MAARYTLHGIWLSGPTYKAGLMLSLTGQEFAYRHVDLRAGAHKQPAYLAINRYGQVPTLSDGQANLNLVQSGSILEYLAEQTGKLAGKSAGEKARAREWIYWEFDRLAPNIYRSRDAKRGFAKFDDATLALYGTQANDALKVLDSELAKTPFVAGNEATIGDVAVYGDAWYAHEAEIAVPPNVQAWMKRVEALPGFQAPYDLLPKEDRG